jgi:hypothetical protein
MDILPAILTAALTHLPLYMAWTVGIILAVVRWQRTPRFSLVVSLSLAGLIVFSLVGTAVSVGLPQYLYRDGTSHSRIAVILGTVGLVNALLQTCCWAGLLVAMFGLRDKPADAAGAAPASRSGP